MTAESCMVRTVSIWVAARRVGIAAFRCGQVNPSECIFIHLNMHPAPVQVTGAHRGGHFPPIRKDAGGKIRTSSFPYPAGIGAVTAALAGAGFGMPISISVQPHPSGISFLL
jgi:hypothetical protein